MPCDLAIVLRRGGTEHDLATETKAWIQQHDEWDQKQVRAEREAMEREANRRRALEKLSPEERKALGL
jgi:hypothetical protein